MQPPYKLLHYLVQLTTSPCLVGATKKAKPWQDRKELQHTRYVKASSPLSRLSSLQPINYALELDFETYASDLTLGFYLPERTRREIYSQP